MKPRLLLAACRQDTASSSSNESVNSLPSSQNISSGLKPEKVKGLSSSKVTNLSSAIESQLAKGLKKAIDDKENATKEINYVKKVESSETNPPNETAKLNEKESEQKPGSDVASSTSVAEKQADSSTENDLDSVVPQEAVYENVPDSNDQNYEPIESIDVHIPAQHQPFLHPSRKRDNVPSLFPPTTPPDLPPPNEDLSQVIPVDDANDPLRLGKMEHIYEDIPEDEEVVVKKPVERKVSRKASRRAGRRPSRRKQRSFRTPIYNNTLEEGEEGEEVGYEDVYFSETDSEFYDEDDFTDSDFEEELKQQMSPEKVDVSLKYSRTCLE